MILMAKKPKSTSQRKPRSMLPLPDSIGKIIESLAAKNGRPFSWEGLRLVVKSLAAEGHEIPEQHKHWIDAPGK